MSRCSGCYKNDVQGFCPSCRKKLFGGKRVSHVLPFEKPTDENLVQFHNKTRALSISGVQLKYSLMLDEGKMVLTERNGQFILKPVPPSVQIEKSDQAPENEHLTMQIAEQIFGISTAANAIIYFQDGTPAYITRRFDVKGDGTKYQQEDMAQLSGRAKQTHGDDFKYDGTYEEVGSLINKYTSAPIPSLERFFSVVFFNYLFSNGDAHLKNFSLIQSDMGDYVFSKAYDLMCTALHTPGENQSALDFYDGYTDNEFYAIYGCYGQHNFRELAKRLGINEVRTERIITQMLSRTDDVLEMIENSLLSEAAKKIYASEYEKRRNLLGLTFPMVVQALKKGSKVLSTDVDAILSFPRGVTKQGRFVAALSDNKFKFIELGKLEEYLTKQDVDLETIIDGDQLLSIEVK